MNGYFNRLSKSVFGLFTLSQFQGSRSSNKISKINNFSEHHCSLMRLKSQFWNFKRQVGKGEEWQGIDIYLLDNRNRTQKWDE